MITLFVSARGVYTRAEWTLIDAETHCKILVIQDSLSKLAHALCQKGVDDKGYITDCFAADIAWLGWSQVIIRSDNDPAVAKLVVETPKKLKVSGIE